MFPQGHNNKRQQGKVGEDLAADFLSKKGFKILKRNFRFERNEIDIIAEDNGELVFIEVKARWSDKYGAPEEAVTEEKQEKIRAATDGYLYLENINNKPCRFDVVAIDFRKNGNQIRHIKNSF